MYRHTFVRESLVQGLPTPLGDGGISKEELVGALWKLCKGTTREASSPRKVDRFVLERGHRHSLEDAAETLRHPDASNLAS